MSKKHDEAAEVLAMDTVRSGAMVASGPGDNPILRMAEMVAARELTADSANVVKTLAEENWGAYRRVEQ